MTTVPSVPKNPDAGNQHRWSPSVPSLLHPYLYPVWVRTYRTCHTCLFRHVRPSLPWNCSRNILTRASVHARNFSRNSSARASKVIRACASEIILAHPPACLCVRTRSSASVRSCSPTSICACGGCYTRLSVVLFKTLYLMFICIIL